MNEAADGMQLEYRRVEHGPDLAGPPVDYVNRAWLREDALPRAVLENSGPVSIPATAEIPVNSAVTMFAMAYREPEQAAATVKWDNRLAAHAGPLPQELLVNPSLQKIAVLAGVPVNGAMEPRERR